MSKEREAFEAWVIKNLAEGRSMSWEDWCWKAWQAAKAQAVPEGFVLVSAEQMSQWGHMANYAEQYGCPECFEARGYAHSLSCEINAYFTSSTSDCPDEP